MVENRRNFLGALLITVASKPTMAIVEAGLAGEERKRQRKKTIPTALIQFDAVPEQIERNLRQMERLVEKAVGAGARWVLFHEGSVCDYTPRVSELAEPVPQGKSTRAMTKLARRLNCYISFGLSEAYQERYYIAQVFVGPKGFIYGYRKTWLWNAPKDEGYRNEWARYDPGIGPELFSFDGIRATCFICADGEAPRCIRRATQLRPEVVFYPNNRSKLPEDFEVFGNRAKAIKAPMLVTNRVGNSWMWPCHGGCAVYSSTGKVLDKANREGKEEILLHELEIETT